MQTAKLFINGSSQAVRLPKNFRFQGDEVGVKKVGEIVLLYPTSSDWENFLNCPSASDDFGDAVLESRSCLQSVQSEREAL